MIRIKHNKAAYAMIKSAVKKGICDIQENPARGVRNLTELGEMFANGPLQKSIFALARTELEREDSGYYRLAEKMVRSCDPDFLATFGLNLGYNCWTYGAKFIRNVEAEHGFNIPWTFVMDMDGHGIPPLALVESLLNQGAEIGIFCGVFSFSTAYPHMEGLLELLEKRGDFAFLFLMEPQLIDDNLAGRIAQLKTVLVAFDLEADEEDEGRAMKTLTRNGCIFGGFVRFDNLDSAEDRMAEAQEKGLPLLVFLQRSIRDREALENHRSELMRLRTRLKHPVFPIDLFGDIAYLDRNISSEACLAIVHGDGSMEIHNLDTCRSLRQFNLNRQPLVEIFRQALPKDDSDEVFSHQEKI